MNHDQSIEIKGQEVYMDFYHRLLEAAGSEHVLRDEPMAAHTTFRIGGPADYFVEPADDAFPPPYQDWKGQ